MCLKYDKIGHTVYKKKNLGTNNPRFQKKKFKVTSAQLEYFFKNQGSLNHRRSNSISMLIINQIKFKNWHIYITSKVQDTFKIKIITLLEELHQRYINSINSIQIL